MATMQRRRSRTVLEFARVPLAPVLVAGLLFPLVASAETNVGPLLLSGEVWSGGRIVFGDNDHGAKFQEYRDLVDGPIGGVDLLFENDEITHWLRARTENAGYDDQRYWLEGGQYGRYEIDAFYGELPHDRSTMASTAYDRPGDTHFVLPQTVAQRNALEAAGTIAPGSLTYRPRDIDLRWREGSVDTVFHVNESLLFRSGYRIQDKHGWKNSSVMFGSPGGTFNSVPARLDETIHEARVGSDYAGDGWSVSLDYIGNFYDDHLPSLTADNPLVSPATATTNPDRGRISTPPDNWSQTAMLSGAARLPIDMPNRIAASFAFGYRRQHDDFLPFSINPRLANPALPENDLDGKVMTLLGNVVATIQPSPTVGAKLRYRIYDYDNETDSIEFPQHVRNDGTLINEFNQSVHNDYQRQNVDLDVNWDFTQSWTGTLGYGLEYWHRSRDREVENLYEQGPNVNLDYRTMGGMLLHAGYQFRTRDGSNYHIDAPLQAKLLTFDANNAVQTAKVTGIRKFDEAERDLHRFDLLAKANPVEDVELTLSSNVGYANYDAKFGLDDTLDWSIGGDAFWQLGPRVVFTSYYTYQYSELHQRSRNRPVAGGVAVDLATNNWRSRTRYHYHNAGADLTFSVVPDVVDWTVGYVVNYGKEKTVASGAAAGAVDYPSVHDLLQGVSTTVSWHFADNMTLRTGYRFEDYNIDDFRDDNIPRFTDGSNLYLGDSVRDYQAHVFVMSAAFEF